MQAVNGLRLVLGTMLDITDDDPMAAPTMIRRPADDAEPTAEHHLYSYLSWLLDSTVTALTGS